MPDTSRMTPVDSSQPPSRAEVEDAFDAIGQSAREEEARQAARRWRLLALAASIAVVVALLASVGAAVIAVGARGDGIARQAAQEATQERQQGSVDRAAAQLDDINRRLVAQGKPPVPLPGPGEDSTDAIARVVLAQVLTQLPSGPNAQAVGAAIAGRVTDNLLGTTRAQVADQAAGYLAANRPKDGRAPTPGEIQAAVNAAYAANPPAPGRPGVDGTNGVNGSDGQDGTPGPPGRGIVSSEQEGPCTRLVRYDQAPFEERWNTCAEPAPPPEPDSSTPAPPTTTD